MNIKDIRVKQVTTKKVKYFLWKKYIKTICVENIIEVKYDNEWVKLNVFKCDEFI